MTGGIRLGSFRGIRVDAHWSVLVVVALLGWGLATRFLPEEVPGLNAPAYAMAGFGIALLFFGSILGHELAHAAFAVRAGVRVEGITLWLLGGVARLDGEARTPADELRIAAAGPAASALVGIAALVLSAVLSRADVAPLAGVAATWLGGVNIILALFNLLPGAPLDGGRIVRAIAWWRGRDRLAASLLAARLGGLLGFGMMAIGVGELVLGSDVGGLWTIVLGFFVSRSALAEGAQETTRAALDGVTVRDVMTTSPTSVPGSLTVDLLVEVILDPSGEGAAFVADAGGEPGAEPLGVVGVAEARRLGAEERRARRTREIAIPLDALPTASPDDALLEVLARTPARTAAGAPGEPGDGGYLLVREGGGDGRGGKGGRIVGLVTPGGLARALDVRVQRAVPAGEPPG